MIRLGFLFRQKKRSLNWIEKHRRTSMLTIVRKKYSLITQHGFVCGMWTMQANWNEIVKWSRTENKRLISSKHKWVNKLEIKTHRQYNWSGIAPLYTMSNNCIRIEFDGNLPKRLEFYLAYRVKWNAWK